MFDFLIIGVDGSVQCHLTKTIDRLGVMPDLGEVDITRVTTVEWNKEKQLWEARLISTGELICSGPVREDVVAAEADYVESMKWVKE